MPNIKKPSGIYVHGQPPPPVIGHALNKTHAQVIGLRGRDLATCSADFCSNDEHNATRLARRAAEIEKKEKRGRRRGTKKKDKARRRVRNAWPGEVGTLLCGITVASYTAYKCAAAKQLVLTLLIFNMCICYNSFSLLANSDIQYCFP